MYMYMFIFNIYSHSPVANVQHQQHQNQQLIADVRETRIPNAKLNNRRMLSGREITDDSQLHSLKRQLFNQINPVWSDRKNLAQDLVYRVAVATNGDIIGYEPIDRAAQNQVKNTPLPKFLRQPSIVPDSINQKFGSFRVVFRKSGALEISPWWGFRKTPDVVGNKIRESRVVNTLQRQLTANLRRYWDGKTSSKQDLKYRVAVNKNGIITDYEPINQVAYDHFRDTPLPFMYNELHGSNVAAPNEKEALAHFRVVFKRNGLLEITPWKLYLFK
jgi:hypothetical protein